MSHLNLDLKNSIRSIVDRMLGGYDLNSYTIEVDKDWTGEDGIFIDLWYNINAREFNPDDAIALRSAVLSMLVSKGELRFPYIMHHLPAGQEVKAA